MSFDFQLLARKLFTRKIFLEEDGEELALLRFAVALYEIEKFFLTEANPPRALLLEQLQSLLDGAPDLATKQPDYFDFIEDTIAHLSFLESQPVAERWLWRKEILSTAALEVPGMVHHDTMKYYRWLGGTLSGGGHAVEIGCWMGRSSHSLAEGLAANKSFQGCLLHALDAFTWDKWLDDYVDTHLDEFNPQVRASLERLRIGDSYMNLFVEFCRPFEHLIKPRSCFFYLDGKSGALPALDWNGEPIELLIQDISGGWPTAQKVWDIFMPSFISNKTVVVFQQYGHMRAEGLRRFCREHADNLSPLHKPYGVAKAFRFTDEKVD
jgi:hypothetical protein